MSNTKKKRRYKANFTVEELKSAAKRALSKREFGFLVCGYHPSVARLEKIYAMLEEHGISSEHWQGWYRKRTKSERKVNPFGTTKFPSGTHLKRRVLQEKLIPYTCALCNMEPVWQGRPLTLHLDHVDGNRKNNHLHNLRFLCPNCHQQTDTWGQKRGRKLPKEDARLLELFNSGKKYKEIAAMFDVSPSTVSHRFSKIRARNVATKKK